MRYNRRIDQPHTARPRLPAIFSLDHKTIGIQYAITAFFFLLFGFALMTLIR
jgi:heme/copper-type cytochrome/quinol oxidase subunit 1